MAVSLLSDRWYRVAASVPAWRPGVRIDRHVVRGARWHLLSDATGDCTVRLDPKAYEVIGRFDGRASLTQIWQVVLARLGADAPTQDEVLSLLTRLSSAGLIEWGGAGELGAAEAQGEERRQQERRARRHPLMMRFSLIDPAPWLNRCGPLARGLFSLPAAALILLILGVTTLIALERLPELARDAARAFASPRAWLIGLAVYVPMKAVHEAMHALALRRFGGLVREAGIAVMMFCPVPYVAAGAADRLAQPGARALVSGAGILAELVLAAAGVLVWHLSEPGLSREIGLAVAMVGAVSTLAANGNPLTRLDGYHVLIDLLDLPNLATRSARWWQEWLLAHWLGLRIEHPIESAPRERRWLMIYAPAATFYRLSIGLWLALWLGEHWSPAAWLILVWALTTALVQPMIRLIRAADQHSQGLRPRLGHRLRAAVGLVAGLVLMAVVPVPDRVLTQGIVWIPEGGQLRAADAGFVSRLEVRDGQRVQAGQPLLSLHDPELTLEFERKAVRRAGLEVERYDSLLRDPARAANLGETIERLDEDMAVLGERLQALRVLAPRSGRLSLPHAADLPGRHLARGERVGEVIDEQIDQAPPAIRVVLDQDEAIRLREGVRAAWVIYPSAATRVLAARLERDQPAPLASLPGPALARAAGGPIDTDPTDPEQLRPLDPTFSVDLRLLASDDAAAGGTALDDHLGGPGQRVDVRLDLGRAPLIVQGWRQLRRTFSARLAPDQV